jgi:hypothetical protein
MTNEIETSIRAESGVYVHVSEWDDGGAWLKMSVDRASIYTPLTRAEAEKLLAGLQALLAKELQHG